jgi:hypothetical protein
VRYFVQLENLSQHHHPQASTVLAVLSRYSKPHADIFARSHHTVWLSTHSGDTDIVALNVKLIRSVVGMVPINVPPCPGQGDGDQPFDGKPTFFVAEKLGLDMDHMSGYRENCL